MSARAERVRPSWLRDYPPLLAIAAGLLIVLAVLPSSLNLPQSNPSETLEYAPVPPEDQQNPPPAGNLGSLGLGRTAGLTDGPAASKVADIKGIATQATTKRCVGNPPRQTEDPLSPPCVAYFKGDNFGATYRGVTREEVRVLVVQGGNYDQSGTSRSQEHAPTGYVDLAKPPPDDDFVWSRMLRLYQRYFNERYQTYGRFVHFFIDYNTRGASPEARRAEAADNASVIKPFAVSDYYGGANQDAYVDATTRYGITNFLPSGTYTVGGLESAFFRKHPGLVWGYDPSVEMRAHNFASYVCRKVVPFPASFSGNAADNGKPRRLGLMHTADADYAQLRTYARIVKADVERCGGRFVADRTFPFYCLETCLYSASPTDYQYAADNMSYFKAQGVSTIIWAGGEETHQSKAAASIDYRPEIVLGGDGLVEATLEGQFQEQSVWANTWAITTYTRQNPISAAPCYQAAKEVDPDAPEIDIRNFGCKLYDMVRQLFTGIQVAGPRLGPTSMEKGYRAIPEIPSGDPRVPACYYLAGDYTCVKDAMTEWWDPSGDDPQSTNPGCMRMAERGKRYLTGRFPKEDVIVRKRPDDLCNVQGLTI